VDVKCAKLVLQHDSLYQFSACAVLFAQELNEEKYYSIKKNIDFLMLINAEFTEFFKEFLTWKKFFHDFSKSFTNEPYVMLAVERICNKRKMTLKTKILCLLNILKKIITRAMSIKKLVSLE
jgi:hypothetical protein